MFCLLRLLRFAKDTVTWLVGLGLIRVLLVRMPPRNYNDEDGCLAVTTG
jgi:hypothetical protein